MHRFRHILPLLLAGVLLVTLGTLHVLAARQESQTIDEAVHLSAGFSYLKTGDFRLNPEHPPLIKMLAALPLVFTKTQFPITSMTWTTWDQYQLGAEFLYHNTLPATTILFLGRLPIIALSLALGWYIFRTSRRWFGDWGGVLSLTLYAFDPGFIAHGHLVTTDLGFSLFAFIAVDRLVTLLERPSRRSAILFFIALWLAGLSKFAILPFLVVLLLVLVLLRLHNTRHSLLQFKSLARRLLVLIPIVFVITVVFKCLP
jgi:4-amino-4-deoxy-L-arabinose transferase-like glycosyltransferase